MNRDKLLIVEVEYRAGTLAQWVKVLFINPHNQSSSLGSSMVTGKNRALKVVLCPRVYTVAYSCLPTCSKRISKCTIKVKLKLKNKLVCLLDTNGEDHSVHGRILSCTLTCKGQSAPGCMPGQSIPAQPHHRQEHSTDSGLHLYSFCCQLKGSGTLASWVRC